MSTYDNFNMAFNRHTTYSPPVLLLKDLISQQNTSEATLADIDSYRNEILTSLMESLAAEMGSNDVAFNYGAEFDTITTEAAEYLIGDDKTNDPGDTPYFSAQIDGRDITNDDQILGISRDQYEKGDAARIFYLDPAKYGGNYLNPPVYIKPQENKGWLGFIKVLFPEISPCKPSKSPLVGFEDIEDQVSKTYDQIPEDERLKGDPDCLIELPYNRILNRPAKAGLEGVITAAIRIYAATHFIKSFASFTTFKPDFKKNYNSIFTQYIAETMEADFKDAQSDFTEFFNPFKDTEFCYAF